MEIKIPKRKPGGQSKEAKEKYEEEVAAFVAFLKKTDKEIGFPISTRGWGYIFEGKGTVTKKQIDEINWVMNMLRKEGLIPAGFIEKDVGRVFFNRDRYVDYPTPEEYLADQLKWIKEKFHKTYECISFWEHQDYYIQMVVEKIDLRTLFLPTAKKYHIPIANAKGWEDISMREDMASWFKYWEIMGKKLVLLYCGDLDIAGYRMTHGGGGDEQKKLLKDLVKITDWDPKNLIVDRFGLNKDFIDSAGLPWVNNLESSKGKLPEIDPKTGRYKDPFVYEYIDYVEGERKCEANVLVIRPELAGPLAEAAIQKYLGPNPFPAYEAEIKEGQDELTELMGELDVHASVDEWLEQLE